MQYKCCSQLQSRCSRHHTHQATGDPASLPVNIQVYDGMPDTAHRLVCTIFCSFCCTTGITLPAEPGPPMRPLTPLKFALAPCSQHSHCK